MTRGRADQLFDAFGTILPVGRSGTEVLVNTARRTQRRPTQRVPNGDASMIRSPHAADAHDLTRTPGRPVHPSIRPYPPDRFRCIPP